MEKLTVSRDQRLFIRIPAAEKARLRSLAKERGITISELVLAAIHNVPIADKAHERNRLKILHSVGFEMNRIGNNINQAVHALHLMNRNGLVAHPSEISKLGSLLKAYLEQRETLQRLLKDMLRP